jgi:hypothetical protein
MYCQITIGKLTKKFWFLLPRIGLPIKNLDYYQTGEAASGLAD